jgi:hypothetical protein
MTNHSGNTTTTTPTINTGESTTIAVAKSFRNFLMIQNNSGANVALNFEGATLTGITPSATNKCFVLPHTAGSNVVRFDAGFVPAGAITAYQTSVPAMNTLVVIEG